MCSQASLCGGTGAVNGFYSKSLSRCLCSNAGSSSADDFCDAECQGNALQAYVTSTGKIFLKLGKDSVSQGQSYSKSDFPTLMLDGLSCSPVEGSDQTAYCQIQNVDATGGSMGGKFEASEAFVKKWQETHPDYVSLYASSSSRRVLGEGRELQASGGATEMPSAIIVSAPGQAVSFETSPEHFPVYLRNSGYNTNPDFDDGPFDTLKTKITGSGVAIASFAVTFATEGVYMFGDYADPVNAQTLVLVSATETPAILPLTADNLAKLGVAPLPPALQVLPNGLGVIAPVFILASLGALFL